MLVCSSTHANVPHRFLHVTFYISHHLSPDLLDPDEGVVKLRIDGLQVFESQRFVQNALVEGQGETRVDELSMEQGLEGTVGEQMD